MASTKSSILNAVVYTNGEEECAAMIISVATDLPQVNKVGKAFYHIIMEKPVKLC